MFRISTPHATASIIPVIKLTLIRSQPKIKDYKKGFRINLFFNQTHRDPSMGRHLAKQSDKLKEETGGECSLLVLKDLLPLFNCNNG